MQNTKTITSTLTGILVAFALVLNPVLAQTAGNNLPDVTGVTATPIENGVTLTWQPVEGADSYSVYYDTKSVQTDGGMYANVVVVDNVTRYEATSLTAGTTYYFAVAAEDSTGTLLGSANYSNPEASAMPLAAAAAEVPAVDAPDTTDTTAATDTTPAESASVVDAAPADTAATADPTHSAALTESGPAESVALALALAASGYFYLRRRAAMQQ
jgi:hypothetical protein